MSEIGAIESWIQSALNCFYHGRAWLAAAVAYASLRLYGFEVSFAHVRKGAYDTHKPVQVTFKSNSDVVGLLELSKECLDNTDARRKQVTDKCKTLLTLTSVLLAVIGVFLPKTLASDSHWAGIAFIISVAALLNTLMLLLVFFDIGIESEVTLEPELNSYNSDDLKKHLVNARLQCVSGAQNRTDYLVDVYRTARFFFLSAFSIVVVLLFTNFIRVPAPTLHERAIHELRGNPELVKLLRGPMGEQGEKGEKGEDGTIDTKAVVDALLRDPRLKQALEEWANENNSALLPHNSTPPTGN